MNKDVHNYDDIINLPHHVSKKHPPMARANRAAQFAPFAALTGYGEAINEAGRSVDKRKIISQEERAKIDDVLNYIQNNKETKVNITFFVPDNRKEGGKYQTIKTIIKKIEPVNKILTLTDKSTINIKDISKIEICKEP